MAVPSGVKYAIIGADWSNSTRGENGPQTYALMHHLMRRHIKFAILGFDVQGPPNVSKIVQELENSPALAPGDEDKS